MRLKDLQTAVDNLNDSYMKRSQNQFQVEGAYGGHKIVVTGKSKKVRGKWVWTGMGSGSTNVTDGYGSVDSALAQLGLMLSNKENWKRRIQRWTKIK